MRKNSGTEIIDGAPVSPKRKDSTGQPDNDGSMSDPCQNAHFSDNEYPYTANVAVAEFVFAVIGFISIFIAWYGIAVRDINNGFLFVLMLLLTLVGLFCGLGTFIAIMVNIRNKNEILFFDKIGLVLSLASMAMGAALLVENLFGFAQLYHMSIPFN